MTVNDIILMTKYPRVDNKLCDINICGNYGCYSTCNTTVFNVIIVNKTEIQILELYGAEDSSIIQISPVRVSQEKYTHFRIDIPKVISNKLFNRIMKLIRTSAREWR